jgi:flagella basal body P-ring formation protein FlgA
MKRNRTAGFMGFALCVAGVSLNELALSNDPDSLESARVAIAAALQARHPAITRIEVTPLHAESRRRSGVTPPAFDIEIPADAALEKRLRVWATTTGKDGVLRRVPSWWTVKAFGPVIVARRGLRAGEQVRPIDVAVEERDVAGTPGALLIADPGMGNSRWRATRFIQPGAVLRRADIEPAPEVLRGQQIRVSVVSDAFTIETTGIARDEGRVGDLIAVSKPGTPERYFAEVTGERKVLIRGEP